MTAAEAQQARDALFTQYMAWINGGCPQSYSINGRTKTNVDAKFWLDQMAMLDVIVARQSASGTCPVASFRRPD